MSKTAIVVYSDPNSGTDEAVGRLFNAMFVAYELKEKKQDIVLIFQGTGVRWIKHVTDPSHPAHALYMAVADTVDGACRGCADLFGATDDIKKTGMKLIDEKMIPGTTGIADLSKYLDDGYRILTF
ncbi:MAG TPA: hypothetical protein ENJ42_02535 [Hellea balneolensis]|uniref:Uncharacterized protein n=1 Tax=Hellea balneolensis TaxID=287478 RepID=A0A7C5LUE0_9PROT|nr:hypothetical protein [Hellea balneolensis]